jgi:hypothetical protein
VTRGDGYCARVIWVHPGFRETKFMGDTVEHNDVFSDRPERLCADVTRAG